MTARDTSVSSFWKMIAGPLNGQDNWAGPNGMGPPTGTGDWRAAVGQPAFALQNSRGMMGLQDATQKR